jgi:hypothetical protein
MPARESAVIGSLDAPAPSPIATTASADCGWPSSPPPCPFPDSPVRPRVCPDIPAWAEESPTARTYFAGITSVDAHSGNFRRN